MGWVVAIILLIVLFYVLFQKSKTIQKPSQKEIGKDKILNLLSEKELSNENIRKQLNVSSRTVVRYMDELEKEGKVKQVGKTGQSVVYKLLKQ